jgi:hypothetical protein
MAAFRRWLGEAPTLLDAVLFIVLAGLLGTLVSYPLGTVIGAALADVVLVFDRLVRRR